MSGRRGESLAPAVLTGAVGLVAALMATAGAASGLEAVSFVTGAACVWLTVKESHWNFPVGILNVATFGVVFLRAGLFADAGLQVIYLALGVSGWYLWLRGGDGRAPLVITRARPGELYRLAAGVILLTLLLWVVLRRVGGSSSFWDALTTSISLGSQWLLNRKRLENWLGWILADAIYVPLYLSKSLYLTALLYAIFLGLAALGLRRWRETWRAGRGASPAPAAVARGEALT